MNAPPDEMPHLIATATEIGLVPPVTRVNSADSPVYDAAQLTENFGVSVVEMEGFLRAAGFALDSDATAQGSLLQ